MFHRNTTYNATIFWIVNKIEDQLPWEGLVDLEDSNVKKTNGNHWSSISNANLLPILYDDFNFSFDPLSILDDDNQDTSVQLDSEGETHEETPKEGNAQIYFRHHQIERRHEYVVPPGRS